MKNEECPVPASTYSYQNEKRDFTKQAIKVLSILLVNNKSALLIGIGLFSLVAFFASHAFAH
jgi:hypothetical protein